MSREIVTSENREEYNNKKLGIKNEKDLPYYDEKGNIYHGKEIVGSLKLEKEPKYHRLSQININSKHQGKGIGSHIIKTVLKEAHEKNFPVTLTTGAMYGKENQKRQRKLYENLGFEKNKNLKGEYGVKEEYVSYPPKKD